MNPDEVPSTGPSTTLTIPGDPKMIREALCVAENATLRNVDEQNRHGAREVLGALIQECDRHRPLGPDGKHGQRHTATCGCDDVPAELVEKVLTTRLPSGGLPPLNEPQVRTILAAVLPDVYDEMLKGRDESYGMGYRDGFEHQSQKRAEFDRWLSERDREVAARALREAAERILPYSGIGLANGATRADVSAWLMDRAARLTATAEGTTT